MPRQRQKTARGNTRKRLLGASLKAFGHRDYDAVSTREIVDSAGANISAISYHFGGKQQLYLATAEYLADSIHHGLQKSMTDIQAAAENADVTTCRTLLREFIHRLVDDLLLGELSEDAAGFIFREQNHPTEAFDILFERLMQPLQITYATLLSRILGIAVTDRDTLLLTHALMGQIVSFRTSRAMILRRLGKKRFSRKDAARIAELISALTLSALADTQLTGESHD